MTTDSGATAGFDYATPLADVLREVGLDFWIEGPVSPTETLATFDYTAYAAALAQRGVTLPATPASPPPPSEPCSGCGGRRWSNDENWQPTFPETWRGERSHGDGLIPCGFCNEAGWDTPDWAPDDDREPTADPIPDSAEQSAPAGSRLPPGTDPGTEPNA
jgi:hypothetical protein